MAPSRLSILVIVLLLPASSAQELISVTVDAVAKRVHEGELQMLFVKDQGQGLLWLQTADGSITHGNISDLGISDQDFAILAATEGFAPTVITVFGRDRGYMVGWVDRGLPFDYPPDLKAFFGQDGPDAAATRHRRIFFFKGCMLAVRDTSTSERTLKQRNAKKLGLPCKPDAAWTSDDGEKIILLKGDKIWFWEFQKEVEGPKPFKDFYDIIPWELVPKGS